MKRFAIFFFLCSLVGCWASAVDRAANVTLLIDQQFATLYSDASGACVNNSANWDEYDVCMDPWKRDAADIARLREVTLNLDVAHGRVARKAAACSWFKAVKATHPAIPARTVALNSKWRTKC